MSREFELRKEIAIDAAPERVWEAITTRAGLTAWFMPMDDAAPDGANVTGWDPPKRFAVRLPAAEDGTTQAFEYLIEAREGGSTVLRFVHSGFLSDNWDTEFEAMTSKGWDMYLHTLAEYLRYFPGRTATFISAEGPPASASRQSWPVLLSGLGLTGAIATGDRVKLTPGGLPPVEGVADYVSDTHLGVRTADALYRFHQRAALGLPVAVGHHLYAGGVDAEASKQAWQSWLNGLFTQYP
jgi:uncharacterized protein YndB with AHSA1/START domain